MAKVSVIVPVYKVEKYLNRCIESLVNQSLKDIEIILVDDGSPDKCPQMCDDWGKRDSRIKVVHKSNGGLSSARNAGIRVASGDYIGFVDSDDDVSLKMYELLYDFIVRENVDFIMTDYIRVIDQEKRYLKTLEIPEGRYSKERIRAVIFPQLIMGENLEYGPLLSVWHCLYQRSFLQKHNIFFDEEVRWSEDNIFSAIVGYCADSFYYLKHEGLYHYYCNPGTITTGYREAAWDVYSIMNQHLHSFFDCVDDFDFKRQLKLHMIFYACNCLGQIRMSGGTRRSKMLLGKTIVDSPQLREAFSDFKFPKWPAKLRIQVFLIKQRWSRLYYFLIGL